MTIYIDSDYKCHVSNDGTMREFDVAFFDGKCQTFVEGYRYIPPGERWVRPDGVFFAGEMISPWQDYNVLAAAQAAYEEAEAALLEELGALVEEIYTNDLGVIG